MGLTAENVAERYRIGRDEQDEFGVNSQQRAEAAIKTGRFKDQIVPLKVKKQKLLPNGKFEFEESIFDTDEGVRPGTTKESIAQLRPAFKPNGTVTAANSSQTSDGAAGVVLMAREKARHRRHMETLGGGPSPPGQASASPAAAEPAPAPQRSGGGS